MFLNGDGSKVEGSPEHQKMKRDKIVNGPNIHNLVKNFSSKEKQRKQNLVQINRQIIQNQFTIPSQTQSIYKSIELANKFQPLHKRSLSQMAKINAP